jgi:hypothetical protein
VYVCYVHPCVCCTTVYVCACNAGTSARRHTRRETDVAVVGTLSSSDRMRQMVNRSRGRSPLFYTISSSSLSAGVSDVCAHDDAKKIGRTKSAVLMRKHTGVVQQQGTEHVFLPTEGKVVTLRPSQPHMRSSSHTQAKKRHTHGSRSQRRGARGSHRSASSSASASSASKSSRSHRKKR